MQVAQALVVCDEVLDSLSFGIDSIGYADETALALAAQEFKEIVFAGGAFGRKAVDVF